MVYVHSSGARVPDGFPTPLNTGLAGKGLTVSQLANSDSDWRFEAAQSGTQAAPTVVSRKRFGYEPGKGGQPGSNFRVTNNVHSDFGTSSPPRAGYHSQPTWNQAPANDIKNR